MTDIVERLRASVTKGHEPTDEDAIEAAAEIERLRKALHEGRWRPARRTKPERGEAAGEIERLTLENWQLKGALGYEVPANIPEGNFKCGLCEARRRHLFQPDEDGDLTGET